MREFGALKGLPYYDLVEEILAARPSMPVKPSNFELKFTMNAYSVNEPQAAAIIGAGQNEGFSLIQGPPGTGNLFVGSTDFRKNEDDSRNGRCVLDWQCETRFNLDFDPWTTGIIPTTEAEVIALRSQ
jgi:hypothetical protein